MRSRIALRVLVSLWTASMLASVAACAQAPKARKGDGETTATATDEGPIQASDAESKISAIAEDGPASAYLLESRRDSNHGYNTPAIVDSKTFLEDSGYSLELEALAELATTAEKGEIHRLSALEILSLYGGEWIEGVFRPLLDDPSPKIRLEAADYLARTGDLKARATLRELLPDVESPGRRVSLAAFLFNQGNLSAFEEIVKTARSPDAEARAWGVSVAGSYHSWTGCPELGGFDPMAELVSALDDPSSEVRWRALIRLGGALKYHLVGDAEVQALQKVAESDPEVGLRKKAEGLLSHRERALKKEPVPLRCQQKPEEKAEDD